MKFMTMNEVADTLSVSRITIHRLVSKGEIKSLKIGRAVRIPDGKPAIVMNRRLINQNGMATAWYCHKYPLKVCDLLRFWHGCVKYYFQSLIFQS
jgi:excisionase family DNA binding protein